MDGARLKNWRFWLKWLWRLAAGAFVALHIYALALVGLGVPGTLVMLDRAIGGAEVQRRALPLEEISPHLVRAVIAAEDSGFCAHAGVDPEAVRKAIDEYRDSGRLRGASTISQQTAKNVFFWNGGGAPRKLGDMWMGTFIDGVWGKRRVMEAYLNVAEWGDGIFGAEAAAQTRFGKSAADLSEREAALLAAVLPSPNKWRLDPPGQYVSSRAGTLQARARLVWNEGLANCVLGKQAPPPAPPKPAPVQEQPDPPVAPDEGDTEEDEAFDALLEDLQDRFEEDVTSPSDVVPTLPEDETAAGDD